MTLTKVLKSLERLWHNKLELLIFGNIMLIKYTKPKNNYYNKKQLIFKQKKKIMLI